MAEHTPGPWTYNYSPSRGYSDEWFVFGNGQAGNPVLAVITPDAEAGLTGATVEANARLIVAAPELLATLKDVIAHLRSMTLDPGDDEDDAPALIAAEALIAKAEGR